MKKIKNLLSVSLVLFAVCFMTALTAFAGMGEISYDYETNTVSATNISAENVVMAIAKKDGEVLESIETYDLTVENGTVSKKLISPIANDETVYLWESCEGGMKPLTKSYSATGIQTVEFKTEDCVEYSTERFVTYTGGKQTNYKLSNLAKFYVNGVEVTYNDNAFYNYIGNNLNGTVTMADTASDGIYDFVYITYYLDAVVDEVILSETGGKVYFENAEIFSTVLTVETDNANISYRFLLDGKEISVSELQENDILSIAYNVNNTFSTSDFYEVLVSRDKIQGQITAYDVEKGYQIDDTYYKVNTNMVYSSDLALGDSYILYLDVFGKIAGCEEDLSAKLYGIIESVYQQDGEIWYVTLIDKEGVKQSYELKDQTAYYSVEEIANQANAENRVVEYTLNSRNCITIKRVLFPMESLYDVYIESTGRLGAIRTGEITKIIVYENENVYGPAKPLVDGFVYDAYGYARTSMTGNPDAFVIIKSGGEIATPGDDGTSDEIVSSDNIGILESVYQKNGEIWYVTFIDKDDVKLSRELKDQTEYEFVQNIASNTKPEDRVIKYDVMKSGRIDVKDSVVPVCVQNTSYDLETNSIGEIKLNENSQIFSFESGGRYRTLNSEDLVESTVYDAYGYGMDEDGAYEFVLIYSWSGAIDISSPLAIYSDWGYTPDEDGSNVIQIKVYVEGEPQYVIIDPEYESEFSALNLINGTPILYAQNYDGYIVDIEPVMNMDMSEDYTEFTDKVFTMADGAVKGFQDVINPAFDGENGKFTQGYNSAYFVFGPVMDKDAQGVTIANYNETKKTSDIVTSKWYGYSNYINVYVYDYNNAPSNDARLSVGTVGSIVKTYVDPSAKFNDGDGIDWNVSVSKNDVSYALLRVENWDITDAYSIIAPMD